ncbi:MAG: hypothetical protein J0H98_06100 [Solirubrobacterales bacterium]|nr:hypothetical protein [Solirubrobacterales bacterium]
MKLKAKVGAFIAAAAVACAIGSAPAQAAPAPKLPSSSELSALCAKSGNATVKSLCSKAVAAYDGCSKQTSSKGLVSCLASAAKGIIGSGVPSTGSTADLIAKLKALANGNTGGLSLDGFNLSSILGKLGGLGGLNLNGLLAKLGG